MKKDSGDYIYILNLSEDEIYKTNKKCRLFAFSALILFLPVLVLFIVPGFASLGWIRSNYEANIAFTFLFFLYLIAMAWNAAQSFIAYRIRRVVKKSQAPFLGLEKMPYMGILCAVVLGSAFFVYFLVLIIGSAFALNTFDLWGTIALAFAAASTVFSVFYCNLSFKTNKLAEREDAPKKPEEKPLKETSTKLYHNMFALTEEEKELGKNEFERESDE